MKRGYAQTRLGQLHYACGGDTAKPAVLLLPQSGRSWSMYAGLAAELVGRYNVYAIDYPGSGSSDPLAADASLEDIAGAVVDFLDVLGLDRVHVYGLHTGNKVGAALAAAWPNRLHRLVFAGQSHSIVPSNAKRLGTTGKTRAKLLAPADERETALVQWADLFSHVSEAWWTEHIMRNIADPSARAGALLRVTDELLAAQGIPQLYRAIRSYDMERDLRRINVPTLILEIATPHEDQTIGRQGPELLAMISGSSLVTLEEEDGHGITLEDKGKQVANILFGFFG